MNRATIVLVAVLLSGRAIANQCTNGSLDSADPEVLSDLVTRLDARSPAQLTICRTGDFAFTWNNESKQSSAVVVLFHNQPLFASTAVEIPSTRQHLLVAMVLEAGRPTVHLADANGDGNFDEIGYDVYQSATRSITRIIDDDADGHPDYELVGTGQGRPALRVRIDEEWFDLVWRDGRLGTIQEMDFRPVTQTATGWRFEEK